MRVHALTSIVFASLLVGCSRSESRTAAAVQTTAVPSVSTASTRLHVETSIADIETCSLVTRPELEAIFGTLKADGRSDRGLRGEHDCRFTNTDGQWLKLSVYGSDRWELEKSIVSELHPESIASLGEEGFRVKRGTDSVLYVRKGKAILETSCSCSADKVRQVTARAVTRL